VTPDDVVASLGDLRVRAPRILEEVSGDGVVGSYDLAEWSAGVAVGRRYGLGGVALLGAVALVTASVARGWPWWGAAVPVLLLLFLAVVFLMKKVWLVLERGDEQVVLHVWDGGQGEEARVRFLAFVLGAAKSSDASS
jgi:hypothetical protein